MRERGTLSPHSARSALPSRSKIATSTLIGCPPPSGRATSSGGKGWDQPGIRAILPLSGSSHREDGRTGSDGQPQRGPRLRGRRCQDRRRAVAVGVGAIAVTVIAVVAVIEGTETAATVAGSTAGFIGLDCWRLLRRQDRHRSDTQRDGGTARGGGQGAGLCGPCTGGPGRESPWTGPRVPPPRSHADNATQASEASVRSVSGCLWALVPEDQRQGRG